jgi:CHAT domain-containing protein
LPFPALRRNEKQYLVEWKPVHTVVSATVYAELKKMRRQRNTAPVELVAFGDPLYPQTGNESAHRIQNTELRSAIGLGFNLARLPFSREEVDSIAALFPGRSQKYLGAQATEERAKSLGKNVRYIHFATHGFLDERFPLNSALALTIPEKVAEGKDNGLLQAWEIFEQVRLDADLVTLSACNTGLGQELGGEGLIGLTRAFQYAGARSILASLWSVDDWRTAHLMKSFYTHLRSGESKDEALRAAQLELLHSRPSSHPFYWAAFSLIGDWQ